MKGKYMTIHHWFYTFLSSTVFVFVIGITNTGNANRLETEAAMNLVAEEELNEQDPWEPLMFLVLSFYRDGVRLFL